MAAPKALAPAAGTRTAPVLIATGGTAELCFLAWLLIKAVNVRAARNHAPGP